MLLWLVPILMLMPGLAQAARAVAAPVPGRGMEATALCQSCHGVAGEGNAAAGFPRLAGLPAKYLERQLVAFAQGQRRNPVMLPIAKALTPEARAAVATYYASLRPPRPSSPAASGVNAGSNVAVLATQGRWSERLPACEQCHAPGGRGVGDDFPPLAAQPAAYLAAQLRAWRAGARPPGPLGLMEVVASKLSDADIDGLAQHFAALPANEGRR